MKQRLLLVGVIFSSVATYAMAQFYNKNRPSKAVKEKSVEQLAAKRQKQRDALQRLIEPYIDQTVLQLFHKLHTLEAPLAGLKNRRMDIQQELCQSSQQQELRAIKEQLRELVGKLHGSGDNHVSPEIQEDIARLKRRKDQLVKSFTKKLAHLEKQELARCDSQCKAAIFNATMNIVDATQRIMAKIDQEAIATRVYEVAGSIKKIESQLARRCSFDHLKKKKTLVDFIILLAA